MDPADRGGLGEPDVTALLDYLQILLADALTDLDGVSPSLLGQATPDIEAASAAAERAHLALCRASDSLSDLRKLHGR